MENGHERGSLYYLIVGENSNTNEGMARMLSVIAVLIVGFGTVFWALIG
ncbi:hypothetical protein J2Y48_004550 [Mycoplana sp. BE70]|nr:hypothetical protein [Mycoplana sp. BE70]MDR6759234.1 hypothetical protein [Mycoplana sp. BE70]